MAIEPPSIWLCDEPPPANAMVGGRPTIPLELLPADPWDLEGLDLIAAATVDGPASAAAAMAAVARGASLLVHIALTGPSRLALTEDLHRSGTVRRAAEHLGAQAPWPELPDEARSLLDALASGFTVTEAAAHLHISRRTANRWLAEVRAATGAASTAEAVSRWMASRPTP